MNIYNRHIWEFLTGDGNYTIGKTIRIVFLDNTEEDQVELTLDNKKSGDYIICSARHTFSGETASTQLLCGKLGIQPPCPDSMISTIATLILPNSGFAGIPLHEPDPLHSSLLELGIQIPVWSWPSPEGRYIRISAHLHNCL